MNNARGTLGTLFAAIQTLLNLIIGLGNKADRGMKMLDRTIEAAEEKQLAHIQGDLDGYAEEYLLAASAKRAESRAKYEAQAEADPAFGKHMEESYNRMMRGYLKRRKAAGLAVDEEDEEEFLKPVANKVKINRVRA